MNVQYMIVQDIHLSRRQPYCDQKLQNLVQAVRRHQCGSQVGPSAEGRSPWTARIFNISNKYLINQSIQYQLTRILEKELWGSPIAVSKVEALGLIENDSL